MKYLFSCWDTIATKLNKAERLLLLVDYDGTLTPIVEKPELAGLSPEVRTCLQTLAEHPRIALGIISGRTLEDIKEKVGIDNIIYTGNHGLEIAGPCIDYVNHVARETRPLLHSLHHELGEALANIKGTRIDDKGLTLSLHYRLVDKAQLDGLTKILSSIVRPLDASGKIKITQGKKVYDIKPPVDWDKGKAIELIAQNIGGEGELLTVFLGDDVTDYGGFRAADNNGGISIFVGEETTSPIAQYFLHSPAEVYQFLDMLRETLDLSEAESRQQ